MPHPCVNLGRALGNENGHEHTLVPPSQDPFGSCKETTNLKPKAIFTYKSISLAIASDIDPHASTTNNKLSLSKPMLPVSLMSLSPSRKAKYFVVIVIDGPKSDQTMSMQPISTSIAKEPPDRQFLQPSQHVNDVSPSDMIIWCLELGSDCCVRICYTTLTVRYGHPNLLTTPRQFLHDTHPDVVGFVEPRING
ncbi:hypothetical protein V6N13_108347 [Hibiscus sabdariffa]